MDSIYLILLFMAPGILVKEIHLYFVKDKKVKQPVYQYMFEIVTDSVVVMMVDVLMLNVIFGFNITTINQLVNSIQEFTVLLVFTGIGIVVSILWYIIRFRVVVPLMLHGKNRLLKKEYIAHQNDSSVWNFLMRQEGIEGTWMVASIYKDGVYVTSGMIAERSSGNSEEVELLLEHTQKVEKLRREQPELFTDWYDYYNPSTGLRVVFYKQETIMEHWLRI